VLAQLSAAGEGHSLSITPKGISQPFLRIYEK
jgi:hypothetical protein